MNYIQITAKVRDKAGSITDTHCFTMVVLVKHKAVIRAYFLKGLQSENCSCFPPFDLFPMVMCWMA